MSEDSDEDTNIVPLADQRAFGTGFKRTAIEFVPASSSTSAPQPAPLKDGTSIAERYLAIVLSKKPESDNAPPSIPDTESTTCVLCDICNCPIKKDDAVPHESSIAHQVCLEHFPGPSSIDRMRKGLAYLEQYGWDPDARKGLGAKGEGIPYPIKLKEKRDTVGLGIKLKKESAIKKKEVKLGPGQIRKKEAEDKKRAKKLHDSFYGNDEVLKQLRQLG